MLRAAGMGVCVAFGLVGVGLDLGSASVRDWFASHVFVTSMAISLVVLGIAYMGIDFAIQTSLRRRWRSAAQPALWQVLEAMVELHTDIEQQLRNARENPAVDGRSLERYAATISGHAPVMTATPELARIYGLVASHLRDAQQLDRIHRDGSVPSWDPVLKLNSAARAATSAIGSFLVQPVPSPPDVRARVETIAQWLERRGQQEAGQRPSLGDESGAPP